MLWVPPRREKLKSRSELYDSDDGDWDGPQGFAMQNVAATWEGNGDGGDDEGGDGAQGGLCSTQGSPRHLFFHPTDMERPRTTNINLDRVNTSAKVGDTSPRGP